MNKYELNNNTLTIKDELTEQIIWQGKPYDCPIKKIFPINRMDGCIILLEYYEFSISEFHGKGNLIMVGPQGQIKWNAELPQTSDTYVDFKIDAGKVKAYSWDGFMVEIDPMNGKIVYKIFTK